MFGTRARAGDRGEQDLRSRRLGRRAPEPGTLTPNLPTSIMDFRGFD